MVIGTDREQAKKRFERGEMAYKEGPIGGCSKVGSCSKLSLSVVTACLDCEFSILDETSFEKVMAEIDSLVVERDQYEVGSLFYKAIQEDIDDLNRALSKKTGGKA